MKRPQRLLVVDDEPSVLQLFRSAFSKHGIEVLTAESARAGLKVVSDERPEVGIFDLMLPDWSGLDLLKEVQQVDPSLPVIFITAGGTSATAIDAMKLGAFDYLTKPLDIRQVRELVTQAFEVRRLMAEPVALGEPDEQAPATGDVMIGRGPAMQEVYKAIGRVAPKNVSVLIRGESGSGKELVARAVYQHSERSEGPFLAVNCAAIPEALLESELFGHEKGAFTGAVAARQGRFELADGGTLFLDEVGELPHETQVKLLRALQEREFERVGGTKTISVNVRVIAATNRDLQNEVNKGNFREDLFYRFNVFPLHSPPLRERGSDIPLLANHFLRKFAKQFGKELDGFSAATIEQMATYGWPGNIRELQNTVERAAILATDSIVELDESSFQQPGGEGTKTKVNRLDDLQNAEKEIIIDALRSSKWKIGGTYGAAAKLNLAPSTLRDRIRKLEIERPV